MEKLAFVVYLNKKYRVSGIVGAGLPWQHCRSQGYAGNPHGETFEG